MKLEPDEITVSDDQIFHGMRPRCPGFLLIGDGPVVEVWRYHRPDRKLWVYPVGRKWQRPIRRLIRWYWLRGQRPSVERVVPMLDSVYDYDAGHSPLLTILSRGLPDRPPPSRYTRIRWRLRAAQRRAGDAWRVLWHGLPEHDD